MLTVSASAEADLKLLAKIGRQWAGHLPLCCRWWSMAASLCDELALPTEAMCASFVLSGEN